MRTCVRVRLRRAPLPLGLLVPRRRLAARRARGGGARAGPRRARADRPRRRLRGRWSSPQAAQALGLRAIHGAEVDARPTARHLTLLVEDASGLAQPLPAADARARAHARPAAARAGRRSVRVSLDAVLEPRRRASSACRAARRTASRTSRRCAACASAFGPERPAGRAPAPLPARRPRAQPRAGSGSRRRLGLACVATGNVHAHARARARAAGRVRRRPAADDARRLRARSAAATTATCWRRRRRWPPASPIIPRRSPRPRALAERLRFDLTRGPRLPLPGRRGRARRPRCWPRRCRRGLRGSATRRATGYRDEARARGSRRSCA